MLVLSLEAWDEPGHQHCLTDGETGLALSGFSAALPGAVLTMVYCSADMEYLLEGALLWRQSHPDCGKDFSSPQRMLSVKSVTELEFDPDTPRCLLGEKLGCARTSSTVPSTVPRLGNTLLGVRVCQASYRAPGRAMGVQSRGEVRACSPGVLTAPLLKRKVERPPDFVPGPPWCGDLFRAGLRLSASWDAPGA